MQAHDELAALFSRNLTFDSEVPQDVLRHLDPIAPNTNQQIVYSVSQHYHHSAHIPKPSDAASQEEPQRPSSEPPQSDSMLAENVLRIHGINPATLTPSQLQLFRIAESSQQRRLLELWSICPPDNGTEIPSLAWSSTTVEQEENLARLRYERQQQQQQPQQQQTMSLDGTPVQVGNGEWHQHAATESEPYMASGYEELMRRERERQSYTPATDPVYLGPDYSRQQQQIDMATQYGAFEQLRGAGRMDTMDVM
jgi:hypothetical protein